MKKVLGNKTKVWEDAAMLELSKRLNAAPVVEVSRDRVHSETTGSLSVDEDEQCVNVLDQ